MFFKTVRRGSQTADHLLEESGWHVLFALLTASHLFYVSSLGSSHPFSPYSNTAVNLTVSLGCRESHGPLAAAR